MNPLQHSAGTAGGLVVADIVTAAAHRFTNHPPAWFTRLHLKVLGAIERCRTAAMGGHLDQCSGCGSCLRTASDTTAPGTP